MTDEEKAKVEAEIELTDHEDEAQILLELRGAVTDKFVYKNANGTFELSYAGTKWAVRKLAERGEAIRVLGHPEIKPDPLDPAEHIVVTVVAERVQIDKDGKSIKLDSTIGSSRGWKNQKLRDGRIVADEHFITKTVSKATRNVQQALMSVEFKREIIAILSGAKPTPKAEPVPSGVVGTAASAAAKKDAGPPKGDSSALRQRVMAAFSLVEKDIAKKRELLKALTGKDKTHDLDDKTMERIVRALHAVKDGSAEVVRNGQSAAIISKIDKTVLVGTATVTAQADEEVPF